MYTNPTGTMIVVIVEHFLNDEGIRYFPGWIETARNVISGYEGFHRIDRLEDVENVSRCVLMLQFRELSLLKVWAKSEAHNELVAELDPFVVQKRQSKVYSVSS